MSVTQTAAPTDPGLPSLAGARAAGVGGFLFLGTVVVENALRQPQPLANAPLEEIARYYGERGDAVALSESFYVVAIPALIVYAVGLATRLARTDAARPWAIVGAIGACMMTATFGAVMAIDVALNARAADLRALGDVARLVYTLKTAMFTVNLVCLGVALLGFGAAIRAAWATGGGGDDDGARPPRFLGATAIVASLLCFAGAFPMRAVAQGSLVGLVGFGGFLLWLLFLATTSAKLLRTGAPSRP